MAVTGWTSEAMSWEPYTNIKPWKAEYAEALRLATRERYMALAGADIPKILNVSIFDNKANGIPITAAWFSELLTHIKQLFSGINARYFCDRLSLPVTWTALTHSAYDTELPAYTYQGVLDSLNIWAPDMVSGMDITSDAAKRWFYCCYKALNHLKIIKSTSFASSTIYTRSVYHSAESYDPENPLNITNENTAAIDELEAVAFSIGSNCNMHRRERRQFSDSGSPPGFHQQYSVYIVQSYRHFLVEKMNRECNCNMSAYGFVYEDSYVFAEPMPSEFYTDNPTYAPIMGTTAWNVQLYSNVSMSNSFEYSAMRGGKTTYPSVYAWDFSSITERDYYGYANEKLLRYDSSSFWVADYAIVNGFKFL